MPCLAPQGRCFQEEEGGGRLKGWGGCVVLLMVVVEGGRNGMEQESVLERDSRDGLGSGRGELRQRARRATPPPPPKAGASVPHSRTCRSRA